MGQKIKLLHIFRQPLQVSWIHYRWRLNKPLPRPESECGSQFYANFKKEVFLGRTDTHTCAFLCRSNVDLLIDGHVLFPINQNSLGRQFEESIQDILMKDPMPGGKF